MSEINTMPTMTSVSTSGIPGGFEGLGYAGPFAARTDELKIYGLDYGQSASIPVRTETDTTLPVHRVVYFAKAPETPAIECYPVVQNWDAPDVLPETRARGIHSSLCDILTMFYLASFVSRTSGDATRPLIRPQYPMRGKEGRSAWSWIGQERKSTTYFYASHVGSKAWTKSRQTLDAIRPHSAGSRAAELIEQISEFTKLEKGWNSYSAPAPTSAAIENAKSLVTLACDSDMIPERVEPSAMGGVGVTFSHGQREVAVEFYNTGKAHALFVNDATSDMTTRGVRADLSGYRQLLEEVRTHLYGKPLTTHTPKAAFSTN